MRVREHSKSVMFFVFFLAAVALAFSAAPLLAADINDYDYRTAEYSTVSDDLVTYYDETSTTTVDYTVKQFAPGQLQIVFNKPLELAAEKDNPFGGLGFSGVEIFSVGGDTFWASGRDGSGGLYENTYEGRLTVEVLELTDIGRTDNLVGQALTYTKGDFALADFSEEKLLDDFSAPIPDVTTAKLTGLEIAYGGVVEDLIGIQHHDTTFLSVTYPSSTDVASITLIPEADAGTEITINSVTVDSGNSADVYLFPGNNKIEITVDDIDSSLTYYLDIFRPDGQLSLGTVRVLDETEKVVLSEVDLRGWSWYKHIANVHSQYNKVILEFTLANWCPAVTTITVDGTPLSIVNGVSSCDLTMTKLGEEYKVGVLLHDPSGQFAADVPYELGISYGSELYLEELKVYMRGPDIEGETELTLSPEFKDVDSVWKKYLDVLGVVNGESQSGYDIYVNNIDFHLARNNEFQIRVKRNSGDENEITFHPITRGAVQGASKSQTTSGGQELWSGWFSLDASYWPEYNYPWIGAHCVSVLQPLGRPSLNYVLNFARSEVTPNLLSEFSITNRSATTPGPEGTAWRNTAPKNTTTHYLTPTTDRVRALNSNWTPLSLGEPEDLGPFDFYAGVEAPNGSFTLSVGANELIKDVTSGYDSGKRQAYVKGTIDFNSSSFGRQSALTVTLKNEARDTRNYLIPIKQNYVPVKKVIFGISHADIAAVGAKLGIDLATNVIVDDGEGNRTTALDTLEVSKFGDVSFMFIEDGELRSYKFPAAHQAQQAAFRAMESGKNEFSMPYAIFPPNASPRYLLHKDANSGVYTDDPDLHASRYMAQTFEPNGDGSGGVLKLKTSLSQSGAPLEYLLDYGDPFTKAYYIDVTPTVHIGNVAYPLTAALYYADDNMFSSIELITTKKEPANFKDVHAWAGDPLGLPIVKILKNWSRWPVFMRIAEDNTRRYILQPGQQIQIPIDFGINTYGDYLELPEEVRERFPHVYSEGTGYSVPGVPRELTNFERNNPEYSDDMKSWRIRLVDKITYSLSPKGWSPSEGTTLEDYVTVDKNTGVVTAHKEISSSGYRSVVLWAKTERLGVEFGTEIDILPAAVADFHTIGHGKTPYIAVSPTIQAHMFKKVNEHMRKENLEIGEFTYAIFGSVNPASAFKMSKTDGRTYVSWNRGNPIYKAIPYAKKTGQYVSYVGFGGDVLMTLRQRWNHENRPVEYKHDWVNPSMYMRGLKSPDDVGSRWAFLRLFGLGNLIDEAMLRVALKEIDAHNAEVKRDFIQRGPHKAYVYLRPRMDHQMELTATQHLAVGTGDIDKIREILNRRRDQTGRARAADSDVISGDMPTFTLTEHAFGSINESGDLYVCDNLAEIDMAVFLDEFDPDEEANERANAARGDAGRTVGRLNAGNTIEWVVPRVFGAVDMQVRDVDGNEIPDDNGDLIPVLMGAKPYEDPDQTGARGKRAMRRASSDESAFAIKLKAPADQLDGVELIDVVVKFQGVDRPAILKMSGDGTNGGMIFDGNLQATKIHPDEQMAVGDGGGGSGCSTGFGIFALAAFTALAATALKRRNK